MTSGSICIACGYLRDTPNHELGCVPFHRTGDSICNARHPYEPLSPGEVCDLCR